MRRKRISPQRRTKHTPQRTCLACQQIKAKRELIRLVHIPEGNIEIDLKGKKAGRGAYLCPDLACWEAGLKGNRLEYALRSQLTPEERKQLMDCARKLFKGAD